MPINPSLYKFTQPVRYFKANDPYYYEVDNLPVRQLEENILWLKDQLSPILGLPSTGTQLGFLKPGDDIDLEWIKQFRPKWQSGRQIKVQAGKYIGRVNDAFQKEDSALSRISSTGSQGDLFGRNLVSQGLGGVLNLDIWQNYAGTLGTSPHPFLILGSNCGLETMFTFHAQQPRGLAFTTVGSPYHNPTYYEDGNVGMSKTWPALFQGGFIPGEQIIGSIYDLDDFFALGKRHLELVRKWKGVFRTAVMDFREETIDIPPFDDYDYFIEDGTIESVKTPIEGASQRLDLLVVYGHPVDSSSTAIDEYPGTANTPEGPVAGAGGASLNAYGSVDPRIITEPRLGIIRGAGVGIKNATNGEPPYGFPNQLDTKIELNEFYTAPGKQKILANPEAEQGISNTGIILADGSIVNGSFPSPDDLGNLAPNLAYNLTSNNLQLIGQIVLPICYIKVSKGVSNLTQEDIIDIRPFLRSTELTYNERAGVAAASPPLSLGNPAVGAAQLKEAFDALVAQTGTAIASTVTAQPTPLKATLPYLLASMATTGATYSGLPESGWPRGSPFIATNGCRMSDGMVLGQSLVVVGEGTANYRDGDADGFAAKVATIPGATATLGYVVNPLYDSTKPWTSNIHTTGNFSFNLGIPMLNIDLSQYMAAGDTTTTESNIMNDYVVVATAGSIGGAGAAGDELEQLNRVRGWSVVERTVNGFPQQYITVRIDMWREDHRPIHTLLMAGASISLMKKNLTV